MPLHQVGFQWCRRDGSQRRLLDLSKVSQQPLKAPFGLGRHSRHPLGWCWALALQSRRSVGLLVRRGDHEKVLGRQLRKFREVRNFEESDVGAQCFTRESA